eukprot:CAMPEP_0175919036 /NCGR_PEP_ID=MMETSP0108-20121206/12189_1 /TAXON_ID=195067 ORGANISM="Goniomonas pacifica, Strain CCMP1869" /NCGR_SAMPLE_ID=MMETSP0108 /ASSEMBLY_ACC=CAM_ASM_000204 /LENGTH=176 /DNA_ID=CAMNT_0017241675 /DNA_START=87 /DNA_END=617 /DNA_ORIENTATION=+
MARHSSFNDTTVAKTACGCPILPIKTSVKGIAPPWTGGPDDPDAIDEAIDLFRANVFFRNYEIQGGGDRLLIYLTLYITQCLQTMEKAANQKEGEKQLQSLSWQNFKVPGEGDFPLSGFFPKPARPDEADTFRTYFKQVREETGRRLAARCYPDPAAKASKFWLAFAKRKFMNKSL